MSRRGKTDICLLLVVIVLAAILGAVLWRGRPDLTAAERERARIENEALAEKLAVDVAQKRALANWILAAKIAAGGLALASITGLVFVGLRWLNRRAAEIRAGADGQFPLVRVKVAGATIIHDPNRQIAAATVYAQPRQANRIMIQPVITGNLSVQERTAARAQAVALTSAAHRHPPVVMSGGGRAALPAQVTDQVDGVTADGQPEPVWPGRVPLTSLLNGGASLTRLVIGATMDQAGQTRVVIGDMARMVHIAVGGSAGWGKSVFVQSLAYQLAQAQERPNLAMVDLDGTTLSPFANCERLLYPLADNEQDALAIFTALADELERRKALFDQVDGVIDLATYNARANDPLSPIICLTDEATALLGNKSVEVAIRQLTLRGRKFGLWCILAGQDWKASSLDTAIRNQLSTRIQFRAMSPSQSRILLMQSGAETLPVPGRCLAILPGQEVQEIQAAQVSHSDIVTALQGQTGPANDIPVVDMGGGNASGSLSPDWRRAIGKLDDIRSMLDDGKSFSAIADVIFDGGRNTKRVAIIRELVESGRL